MLKSLTRCRQVRRLKIPSYQSSLKSAIKLISLQFEAWLRRLFQRSVWTKLLVSLPIVEFFRKSNRVLAAFIQLKTQPNKKALTGTLHRLLSQNLAVIAYSERAA